MMCKKLPEKQEEILCFIGKWILKNKVSPTLGDIVDSGIVSHKESASRIIKRLIEKGFLSEKPIEVRRDLAISKRGKAYIKRGA